MRDASPSLQSPPFSHILLLLLPSSHLCARSLFVVVIVIILSLSLPLAPPLFLLALSHPSRLSGVTRGTAALVSGFCRLFRAGTDPLYDSLGPWPRGFMGEGGLSPWRVGGLRLPRVAVGGWPHLAIGWGWAGLIGVGASAGLLVGAILSSFPLWGDLCCLVRPYGRVGAVSCGGVGAAPPPPAAGRVRKVSSALLVICASLRARVIGGLGRSGGRSEPPDAPLRGG